MGSFKQFGKRKRRRRHKHGAATSFEWDTEKQKSPAGLGLSISERLFFSVMAVSAIVLTCILIFSPDHTPEKGVSERSVSEEPVPLPKSEVRLPPADKAGKSEAVIAVLLAFVNAPDHGSRCEYLIGRAAMLDQLESHYRRDGHPLPLRIVNPTVTAIETSDREIVIVSFVNESGKRISAPFEWDLDSYRLHWEAMTGYGDIPWEVFFNERPKGTFAMRANLYVSNVNRDIPDKAGWITALLSHPDLSQPRAIAIPIGSDTCAQLLKLPPDTDIPVYIGIQWPDEEDSVLPVITRWYHRDWITP